MIEPAGVDGTVEMTRAQAPERKSPDCFSLSFQKMQEGAGSGRGGAWPNVNLRSCRFWLAVSSPQEPLLRRHCARCPMDHTKFWRPVFS
jgi:hypothetical protein